jgi:hypothetical protein
MPKITFPIRWLWNTGPFNTGAGGEFTKSYYKLRDLVLKPGGGDHAHEPLR